MKLDDRLQAFLSHGAIAGIEVMWDFAAELQARMPEDAPSRELAVRYFALLEAFQTLTVGLESGAPFGVVLEQVIKLQSAAGSVVTAYSGPPEPPEPTPLSE